MPLFYLRRLTGTKRTESGDRHLARYLAFVAGAVNAGGFLAVRQYTSHMSGIVSAMADNLAAGSFAAVLSGLAAVAFFLLGAFITTLLIRWARRRGLESEFALPLILEAVLLVVFGVTGRVFTGEGRAIDTILLLCFTMGLQNAMVTKLSHAVIRTTHLTGMVTDMGIALGRIAFASATRSELSVAPELSSLCLHGSLVAMFFVGGVTGAFGFKYIGFFFTLPLAAILLILASLPVWDDLRRPYAESAAKI